MGRRPSALIVEFFDRGPKLADSSNRYQHTCKRCGEEFPKGRSDRLTNHLVRKCSQITDQDRQWVSQYLSSKPIQEPADEQDGSPAHPSLLLIQDQSAGEPSPSYQQQHEQSALDTLAEVSRRHLDYSSPVAPPSGAADARGKTLSEVLAEQELITELSNYVNPISQLSGPQEAIIERSTAMDTSPLVHAATAASQQLELAQALQTAESGQKAVPVDPQLNRSNTPERFLEGIQDFQNISEGGSSMTWIPKKVMRLEDPPKILADAPTSGFGLLQQPRATGKRKRFDVARRQQVSDIRKQGACIRCRMLKKPCSEDTPCTTCQAVQSARVWKVKCLRTKLADEFTLWCSGLFQAQTTVDNPTASQPSGEPVVRGRIEARTTSSSGHSVSFAAKVSGDAFSPSSDAGDGAYKVVLIDEAQYTDELITDCADHEPSAFMRATLKQALELLAAEDISKIANNEAKTVRSCYSLQDQLLKNVIELWAWTSILTLHRTLAWDLRFIPAGDVSTILQIDDSAREPTSAASQTIPESSSCHSSIISQLLAGVESRCGRLSKTVMNELERRLLQRKQVSPFATFISAVILLDGVERMCGFFRSFDGKEMIDLQPFSNLEGSADVDQQSAVDAASGEKAACLDNPSISWHLEKQPSSFWSQGFNFAELVVMLLRMRALPPKTRVTYDGTLEVSQDSNPPMWINGRMVQMHVDKAVQEAATWLDPLGLKVADLDAKRGTTAPGEDAGIEAWEMQFVSQLLLPVTMQ